MRLFSRTHDEQLKRFQVVGKRLIVYIACLWLTEYRKLQHTTMAAPPNPTSEAIPYPNLAFGTGLTFGFGVRTALLYGVFVTEKSYLIGLRKLIKREHISMLISHVCGDRFPQEVVDIIEQSLYDLEKDIVDSAWKGNAEDNENIRKFLPGLYAPWPAQEATRAKLVCHSM